MQTKRLHDVLL